MANNNNSSEYRQRIRDIVNSQFIDDMYAEYGYLFDLLPISPNPDTAIQRALCQRVGEYQAQHHIKIKRDFMMEHEIVLMSKFFINRVIEHKERDDIGTLEELLKQINPDGTGTIDQAQAWAWMGAPEVINHNNHNNPNNPVAANNNGIMGAGAGAGVVAHNDVVEDDDDVALNQFLAAPNGINNNVIMDDEEPELDDNVDDDDLPVAPVDEPMIADDNDDSISSASDDTSDSDSEANDNVNNNDVNNDNADMAVGDPPMPHVIFVQNNNDNVGFGNAMEQVRQIIARGAINDDDMVVINNFRTYVRELIAGMGGTPRTDVDISAPQPIETPTVETPTQSEQPAIDDDVIADITELAQMDLEVNYADNIPVYIEFPKEPVDEGILDWVGPAISNYSVQVYRTATDVVRIEAILTGNRAYSIRGVGIKAKDLIRLLMFLSPTFAYNLTHKKFVDTPLHMDMTTQALNAFMPSFINFYGSQTFADCALLVSGYTFYAHRIVLANESKLFRNYYEGNWGHKNNIAEPFIIEADAHLFGKILDFVYTRKLSCVNTAEVVDLYAIADAYCFVNLLCALNAHINPIIKIAIQRRLYENHPLPPLERDNNDASLMQEVD
ncbi:TD and POZ domain-containing protein [Faustovirus]|nr:TD and POZ domain-containing protein [Faustovirus]